LLWSARCLAVIVMVGYQFDIASKSDAVPDASMGFGSKRITR